MTNKQRLPLILTSEPIQIKIAPYIVRPFLTLLTLGKSFILLPK